jgi:hypothetical protein
VENPEYPKEHSAPTEVLPMNEPEWKVDKQPAWLVAAIKNDH